MALNTAHSGKGVVLFGGEQILLHQDSVELTFEATPTNNYFKGTKKGKAYLTNQRVLFQSTSSNEAMKSFSMPFYYMKQVEVKQAIFGANSLTGVIKAQPNGGWEGQAEFKYTFKAGGAIDFAERLLRVATKVCKKPYQAVMPSSKPQVCPSSIPCTCMNSTVYGNPYSPQITNYGNPYVTRYGNPYLNQYPEACTQCRAVYRPLSAPKGPPPAPGQAPPPQPQPQFYPQPMPNGNMYGNPYPYPSAPPAGYSGYPPQAGVPPPAGYPPAGYPPAGTAYQNGQPYPQADPAYPPPAYSEAVAGAGVAPSAPPATDGREATATAPGGNAYYNPANPQQAYIPQSVPQRQPPPYSEKPKVE